MTVTFTGPTPVGVVNVRPAAQALFGLSTKKESKIGLIMVVTGSGETVMTLSVSPVERFSIAGV